MSPHPNTKAPAVVEAELRSDNITAAAEINAALPNVLILGDSISIGYTPVVRQLLANQANVYRPNINCQHTGIGMALLDTWLSDIGWDVISFNFDIWDTHLLDSKGNLLLDKDGTGITGCDDAHIRHTPEQYRENLTEITTRLQARCKSLIWISTTPITYRKGERFETIPRLNRIADEVMQLHHVPIVDLYSYVIPHAAEWLSADQCHFNQTGNYQLGTLVTTAITSHHPTHS